MYEVDKYVWSFYVIYHSMLGFYYLIWDNQCEWIHFSLDKYFLNLTMSQTLFLGTGSIECTPPDGGNREENRMQCVERCGWYKCGCFGSLGGGRGCLSEATGDKVMEVLTTDPWVRDEEYQGEKEGLSWRRTWPRQMCVRGGSIAAHVGRNKKQAKEGWSVQAISRRRKTMVLAFHRIATQNSRLSQDHALTWPLGGQVCTKNFGSLWPPALRALWPWNLWIQQPFAFLSVY